MHEPKELGLSKYIYNEYLRRNIEIIPSELKEDINLIIKNKIYKLINRFDNTEMIILDIPESGMKKSEGKVIDNGNILYTVEFLAKIYKYTVGDIVDITVTSIEKSSIFGKLESATVIIPQKFIVGFTYYNNLNMYVCTDEDEELVIKVNTKLRVRLLYNKLVQHKEYTVLAAMDDHYLGVVSIN